MCWVLFLQAWPLLGLQLQTPCLLETGRLVSLETSQQPGFGLAALREAESRQGSGFCAGRALVLANGSTSSVP